MISRNSRNYLGFVAAEAARSRVTAVFMIIWAVYRGRNGFFVCSLCASNIFETCTAKKKQSRTQSETLTGTVPGVRYVRLSG